MEIKRKRGRPKLSGERPPIYDAQLDKQGSYVLTAVVSNQKQTVKGNSLSECFDKLNKNGLIKGKCTFHVDKGELKADMFLSPMKVKRLYFNKTYRQILEKQLNLRLT